MKFMELPGLREELLQVECYMQAFLPAEREHGRVAEIIRAVTAAAGKRCRPRLVLLAGRLGPEYPASRERLCKLGALVELVHMASLVHDDVVDDSPLRRGQATIQSRFGKDMAVYTGDLILGRVMRTLFQEDMGPSGELIGRTIEDMCRGEIGQFDCRYRADAAVGEYMEHIYGKTVSMFVTACRLGGMESGCSPAVLDSLVGLGEHLGYLFQIRDDLLDFLSDEAEEGKPTHVDFREGVFTLPVLYALENSLYAPQVQSLANRAAAGVLTERDLERLDGAVRASGGLSAAVHAMDRHGRMAARHLAALPAGGPAAALGQILRLLALPESMREAASSCACRAV